MAYNVGMAMHQNANLPRSFAFALLGFGAIQTAALTANPILSRGKTVYTSNGNAPHLVDNKFKGTVFNVSNGSWIAMNIGSGPAKLFVNWNNTADAWSNELAPSGCPKSNSFPVDYDILKSSNSTNGSDGAWSVVESITNNLVTARGHLVDFSGASWIKMSVKKGGGSLDEFEVFNATQGSDDIWFFAGTSITQGTFKENAVSPNFADRIVSSKPGFNPAVIRGGIGCIRSGDMTRNLSKYLAAARNARYWAIEMGTNDGWGGGNANVGTFTKNMQQIIDSCKALGIIPVLSRTLATNPAKSENGWQVHEDYLKAVDDLTSKNNLPKGPDFFTWFKNNPGELKSDGIHPSATGAASIQKLWADAAASLYTSTSLSRPLAAAFPAGSHRLSAFPRHGRIELHAASAGTAYIHAVGGRLLDEVHFASAGRAQRSGLQGLLLVRFVSAGGAAGKAEMESKFILAP